MSILNITNLTDNPVEWITNKYKYAFEEYENEKGMVINEDEKYNYIASQIDYLEEQMEEAKGSELLGIIDNYLVNLDYYSEVKEWYQNR